MAKKPDRLLATVELTRIALVWTAISNIWLIVLLSRAFDLTGGASHGIKTLPLWALLLCTAAVAAGMYVFGMVLNDVMDSRRDRALAPGRPIPSGRINLGEAAAVAVAALVVSIAGSVPLGPVSTSLCLACAVAVLFYNALGKHVPGVGIVTLGLIRACHMLIANPSIGYVWPLWLTMSHVIGISAAAYVLEGKRPPLRGRGLWIVVSGWAFATVGLIGWMRLQGRLTLPGSDWAWAGPAAAALLWVFWAIRTGRSAPSPKRAGELIIKNGLLYLILYDAAWLVAAGLLWQAALIASLYPAALATIAWVRHLRLLSDPVTFRRAE